MVAALLLLPAVVRRFTSAKTDHKTSESLMTPVLNRTRRAFDSLCALGLLTMVSVLGSGCIRPSPEWAVVSPESEGLRSERLDEMWNVLRARKTTALLIIRNDRIVFEGYAGKYSRSTPHYTASLAKSLVGGLALMLAMDDDLIHPDDRVSKYVPQWAEDPRKSQITVRHLATHTSGLEDAEEGVVPHEQLTGWKGDFWKQLPVPHDPFTISRDITPVLDPPGTTPRYSNPGFAMLGYSLTASLRNAPEQDLRSLLGDRIMDAIGVSRKGWSIGYGRSAIVAGLPVLAAWGGGNFSPDATARIGRLLLHKGRWDGKQLISPATVGAATSNAGMPNHSGLGWWVNQNPDGTLFWPSVPADAFWGLGAQGQLLLVVPSLSLIAIRYGGAMTNEDDVWREIAAYVVEPLMHAFSASIAAPYPRSPVIKGVKWADQAEIVRFAPGCDLWPITWAEDDALYTVYGDGNGFSPFVPEKLSLGFARVTGSPPTFSESTSVRLRESIRAMGPRASKQAGFWH